MKTLLLSLVLISNISFADDYDSCLDRLYSNHQGEVDTAKEVFKKQSEDCFRFPDGEEYYACQNKAKETFDKAIESANSRVQLGTRACLKYPWL